MTTPHPLGGILGQAQAGRPFPLSGEPIDRTMRVLLPVNLIDLIPPVVMDFGHAIACLKAGHRVARLGWNGKDMWLALSPGSQALPADRFWAGPNREFAAANGGTADVLACITMKTADGKILMGWLASQSDMLAEDWVLVP